MSLDYTQFKPKKPKDGEAPSTPQEQEAYWWQASKGEVHQRVFDVMARLRKQQSTRILENLKWNLLYGERDATGTTGSLRAVLPMHLIESAASRLTYNVVRMVIDTIASKIASNNPKPTFQTDKGSYDQQKRAKGLESFVQGVYYENNVYEKQVDIFIDAAVEDLGVLKWYRDPADMSKIRCERQFPSEAFVDEEDGRYGEPRQLFQSKSVSKNVVRKLYAGGKNSNLWQDIGSAQMPDPIWGIPAGVERVLGDHIEVVECWRLPSSPDAKDGRHVICVSSAVLLDEEWSRDDFPFSFYRWSKRRQGFRGQGVVEQIAGIQLALNKVLKTISAILHLCSVPRYLVEETSDVVLSELNNRIGAVVKFRGVAPKLDVQNAVPPELFAEVERNIQRAYERAGVSQLSVASRKPAGLESAPSLREYSDIEAARFVIPGKALEQWHVRNAKQILALAEEISSEVDEDGKLKYPDFGVMLPGKKGMERIKWKDVRMDREKYVLKIFPTSSLPTTPAAKQQTVSEWQQMQWIDPLRARQLMDLPDLDAANDIDLAAREDIEETVQRLLDSDGYVAPEAYQDLAFGLRRMQLAYLKAKYAGVPQVRLDNMQAWLNAATETVASAQKAAAGPPALPAQQPDQTHGQDAQASPPPAQQAA